MICLQVPDDRRHESADCDSDSAHPGPGSAARDTDPASAAGQHPENIRITIIVNCFILGLHPAGVRRGEKQNVRDLEEKQRLGVSVLLFVILLHT